MTTKNFTATFLVAQSPEEVFKKVNDVRAWWSGFYSEEINGELAKLNDEFIFRAGGGAHYSRQKLIEIIPGQKLVWLITESELSFLKKKDEWTGTKMIFDISKQDDKTRLVFTHEGLTPAKECYDSCAPAWSKYLHERLLPLITTARDLKGSKEN